jgi:hypothetical protein
MNCLDSPPSHRSLPLGWQATLCDTAAMSA